jgi:inorganic pyrophosphatase
MRGEPVKYEIDKESGAIFVDRFLATAMFYPCNYGFIPQTLSEDGDPVDVLVITPVALMSGSVISCRPVAMLKMTDEKGFDAKIYGHIQGPEDISKHLLESINHFFEHYKDLEVGKWVKVEGWTGAHEAKQEILASAKRYKEES